MTDVNLYCNCPFGSFHSVFDYELKIKVIDYNNEISCVSKCIAVGYCFIMMYQAVTFT